MRVTLSTLALTLALAGCGGGTDTTPDGGATPDAGVQTRTEKISALTGSATAGKTTYDNTCSSCHGATGTGGSAPGLHAKIKSDSKAVVIDLLLNGVPNTNMSSYAFMTDQQIADLYAYMKANFSN